MSRVGRTIITVTDQFCGAGGSSIGATAAGAELRLALNHWQVAIETHNTNFPNADHDCTEISACDPRKYPSTDILITSPECTNHTLAKGRPRKWQSQLDLFGKVTIDPSEERSRATMWDVPRFAEYHDYRLIIVENVVEARLWAPWEGWLHAMHCLGYDHQCVYLNSMHAHPTPQSRDRMYVVFHKTGNKRPNLAITPLARCPKCERDVQAVQSWKPGRSWGKYRQQYVYCCQTCGSQVEPYYYAAATAIDWSVTAQRIGDRTKPLKDTTLKRIQVGLDKFALIATIATIATQGAPAVVPPFLTSYYGNGSGSDLRQAMPTLPTHDRHALVQPGAVPAVEDCGFRMLEPHELGRAMAFPDDYKVTGTKRDRVKQFGNAVTPPVMHLLMQRCMASLQ